MEVGWGRGLVVGWLVVDGMMVFWNWINKKTTIKKSYNGK